MKNEQRTTDVTKQNIQLKKSLSKWDLLTIGVGAVVGWSWVIYAGVWTTIPGTMGGVIWMVPGTILLAKM